MTSPTAIRTMVPPTITGQVIGSDSHSHPRSTATTGFTYPCVETREIGACASSQTNVQNMVVASNVANASLFGGPAIVQSDNAFSQSASNYNTATNIDAFLVLGRLGLIRAY